MAKNSAARIAANNRYKVKAYDEMRFISRKADRLPEQIKAAAALHDQSASAYIVEAVRRALDMDGVNISALPPVQDEKQPDE